MLSYYPITHFELVLDKAKAFNLVSVQYFGQVNFHKSQNGQCHSLLMKEQQCYALGSVQSIVGHSDVTRHDAPETGCPLLVPPLGWQWPPSAPQQQMEGKGQTSPTEDERGLQDYGELLRQLFDQFGPLEAGGPPPVLPVQLLIWKMLTGPGGGGAGRWEWAEPI